MLRPLSAALGQILPDSHVLFLDSGQRPIIELPLFEEALLMLGNFFLEGHLLLCAPRLARQGVLLRCFGQGAGVIWIYDLFELIGRALLIRLVILHGTEFFVGQFC